MEHAGLVALAWHGILRRGVWDLSSLARDQTHVPCIGRQILNHWATREVPDSVYIFSSDSFKKHPSHSLKKKKRDDFGFIFNENQTRAISNTDEWH